MIQEEAFNSDTLMQGLAELAEHEAQYREALASFEKVDAAAAIAGEIKLSLM